MRLIDADKLPISSIDITDLPQGKGLMCYLAEDVENALTIKAIPLDKVKQAREKMKWLANEHKFQSNIIYQCIIILDKLIESEEE